MEQILIDFFARAAILLPAFLIAVSFHEFCHALTAFYLGDHTAQKKGRLTLNPLAHIDPIGLLFLIVFRIGWATPVPIDHNNFKHPRLYSIITALAGPLSNFFLALVAFGCIKFFPATLFQPAVTATFVQIFGAIASVNIMLGVFNLLPIPPLDGSHILTALLVKSFPNLIAFIYRYALFILLLIFLLPQTSQLLYVLVVNTERFLKSFIF